MQFSLLSSDSRSSWYNPSDWKLSGFIGCTISEPFHYERGVWGSLEERLDVVWCCFGKIGMRDETIYPSKRWISLELFIGYLIWGFFPAESFASTLLEYFRNWVGSLINSYKFTHFVSCTSNRRSTCGFEWCRTTYCLLRLMKLSRLCAEVPIVHCNLWRDGKRTPPRALFNCCWQFHSTDSLNTYNC